MRLSHDTLASPLAVRLKFPSMVNVRFGSKADICSAKRHVRFTPNSDRKSGQGRSTIAEYGIAGRLGEFEPAIARTRHHQDYSSLGQEFLSHIFARWRNAQKIEAKQQKIILALGTGATSFSQDALPTRAEHVVV